MTSFQFHFPASNDATLTIALPEALRGEPLNVVVAKEPAPSKRSTMREFVETYSGILADCGIESVPENRPTENSSQKGILGLRGILKEHTIEELEGARDEYLTEKYIHD